jgi:hypothetical protein
VREREREKERKKKNMNRARRHKGKNIQQLQSSFISMSKSIIEHYIENKPYTYMYILTAFWAPILSLVELCLLEISYQNLFQMFKLLTKQHLYYKYKDILKYTLKIENKLAKCLKIFIKCSVNFKIISCFLINSTKRARVFKL